MESSEPANALPASVAPSARVYLSPCAIGPLIALAPPVAAGSALPLAGGPLAFAACEIAIRDATGVTRTTASLADTRRWAARQGTAVEARVTDRLDTLSRPRRDPRGAPLPRPLLMGIVNATPDSFSNRKSVV